MEYSRRAFIESAALAAGSYVAGAGKPAPIVADVIVVGATSGGIIAAIQVARQGGTVVVLEHGHHVGGMSASGLGWTDFTHPDAIGGLAREFYATVGRRYGNPAQLVLEPHVAESTFLEMAKSSSIRILFGVTPKRVVKTGPRITHIVGDDGTEYRAKIFFDATYEGDLMALAKVSYIVGREANAEFNETLNGIQTGSDNPRSGKFLVYPDPWRRPGDPSSGMLPYMLQAEDLGVPGSADHRVQAYTYRLCLTDQPYRVAIAAPKRYDPARYELLARWIEARQAAGEDLQLKDFMKYDPLPNHKWDFNNRWPISLDYLGGSDRYPEADWKERRLIEARHEDYLRGFLHFLGHDHRVPASVREEMLRFGLSPDEFPSTGNWPHQIYVREARRMRSGYVMTEHNALGTRTAPESVGLASYGMDMHAVRRIVVNGLPMNEGSRGRPVAKPYPIAYDSIVPAKAECENLLVTFCLSASHVGFASIRMEPVFMILSQSAAIAAMVALQRGCPVQDVDYAELKPLLLAAGQKLDWNA